MTATETSPSGAAAILRPTDSLAVPLGTGQPVGFLHALGERTDWTDLVVHAAMLVDFFELFGRAGVRLRSTFYGPIERLGVAAGAAIEFVPADFRRFGPVIAAARPRVVATAAAPPDADGWCSLSLHAGGTVAELHAAGADPQRVLVVEVSEHYPRTAGLGADHPHRLHVDEIDVLVRSDRHPVELVDPAVTPAEERIAELACGLVPDRATLQTGFGSIPSVIAARLADGDGGGYGVHSEMLTTGLMALHLAGKVTNRHKGVFEGRSITTFAAGTTDLYRWLDGNSEVAFLPVEVVNAPHHIAANRNMITICGAIAVDLAGQVVADTIGHNQWSGVGGHEDFVSGGSIGSDDKSLVCLASTATVADTLVSRIVIAPLPGSLVTTPRHQTDVVITEFGVAELRGRTVRERALALAAIAHPSFRDELETAAARLG